MTALPRKIRSLHIVGQLEPGGVSSWLKSLVVEAAKHDELGIAICCNYRISEGLLATEFRDAGCKVFHIPLGINLLKYLSSLKKHLKNNNYDIVQDHRSFLSGATLRSAARARVPVRVAFHHSTNDHRMPGLGRKLYAAVLRRWTNKYATNLWGCSKTVLVELYGKDWQKRDPRCMAVYGAANLKEYSSLARKKIREEFKIPENQKVIGFVGRVTLAKNPLVAIGVCVRVLKEIPHASVLWVGDGPLLAQVKEESQRSGVGDRIHFTGFRRDVPELLAAMDLFFQPSLWEGFGLGKLEALASGLRVVGSRAPGFLEAFPDKMLHLCSEANDIEGHIAAIKEVFSKPLIREVPTEFLKQFTEEEFYKRIMQLYDDALKDAF